MFILLLLIRNHKLFEVNVAFLVGNCCPRIGFLSSEFILFKIFKNLVVIQSNNPTLLDWPVNSPDLNPIENVWAAIKKEIRKNKIITNKRDLIENIIKAWHNTDEEIVKKCIASIAAYKMGLLEKEDSLNIEIVFVLLNLYCPKLINL